MTDFVIDGVEKCRVQTAFYITSFLTFLLILPCYVMEMEWGVCGHIARYGGTNRPLCSLNVGNGGDKSRRRLILLGAGRGLE